MANIEALPILLKELRLHAMSQQWEDLAQLAIDKDWVHDEYLATLCEEEMALRYQKHLQRFTREAKLAPGKTLASVDFRVIPAIKKARIEQKRRDT